MGDLVVTVKHLLDELNISNDGRSRTDHLFQAESLQELRGILNGYINYDMGDTDSTNQRKMLVLIDSFFIL